MSRSRESSDVSERVAALRSVALGFVECINGSGQDAAAGLPVGAGEPPSLL